MYATTNKPKRLLSLVIVLTLLLSMIPLQAFAAPDGSNNSQNNTDTVVEEWSYLPKQTTPTLLTGKSETSSNIVEVTVTATDRSTGETVTVPGATVNLYVGSELRSSVSDEDNDGIVEISLAGLSFEERQNATISANKVVSRGTAINGTDRDDLFENFPINPDDADGNYYRYTLELHSETIDSNGNWEGAKIPESKESNKVDIVFIIDATGSMSDEINNVKNNIASFSENLIDSGLDIRFCIIDYRDITLSDPDEQTHVYTTAGSHWMTSIDSVVDTLGSIDASGGGDTPETVVDPLGYVADNNLMKWRSDAYRFAFVLTDANHKANNNYGYSSLEEVTDKLAEMEVVTSVICNSYYDDYDYLYETTGGIWANIYSSYFDDEMLALSDSIIESVTREMTLNLSEPRLLVNMSVCYLANNRKSQSESYKNSVKEVMNEFALRLAEVTDGHVMLDKVLLFSTANRMDFYNTSELASMADIRIETRVNDDGKGLHNVTIRSNAHPTGFYNDGTYTGDSDQFKYLKDGTGIDGNQSFYRIQLSGTTDGWNVAFTNKDDQYEYSTTIMHEAGHYLLGFYDEYLDANGDFWNNGNGILERGESSWTQPYFGEDGDTRYGGYGLMDNHHYGDIELSKAAVDYTYMTSGFSGADISQHTNQSYKNEGSCEDSLATLLTDPSFSTYNKAPVLLASDYDLGDYAITYTKASADRNATYPYAALSADDYLTPALASYSPVTLYSDGLGDSEAEFTSEPLANVAFTSNDEAVAITVDSDVVVGIMKSGDVAFSKVTLTDGAAELPIAKGDVAEIRIVDTTAGKYNTYYIDRTEDTDAGYIYTSADTAVMAYVTTDELSSYTFVAENISYENGEYHAVNQATRISSDNGVGFDSGEIYSVADYQAEIDYTTMSWFKYADGEWTALATDISEEENMNLGARADLDGEGLYVLMAKAAPTGDLQAAKNLEYAQSEDLDAVVHLSFDDPNTNSKYYNVYYSDSEFTDKNADNVVVRSFPAGSTNLTINLLERGRTVYAAVEIVAEDGSRSPLSDIILIGGEADSDGDGIPDWYCNKYLLWGKDGEDKDIANSDDDGDGLTNLQEYQGGSDPTNPNDPVHTTNIPVASISVSANSLFLTVGETAKVTATVKPANASNKAVNWISENEEIASVKVVDGVCTITALEKGNTQIYAVTVDGGYSAAIDVTVDRTTTPMYRLYNPNTGEHHFTGSIVERDNLVDVGWNYEGIGWYAPIYEGDPVYRTFNPNSGDHHYTMSWEEVQNLVEVGWLYEGVAWNSAGPDLTPQYRMYNPNADLGSHHYTSSIEERNNLTAIGWIWEGIGWFGFDAPI